jgi:hypothetical protein
LQSGTTPSTSRLTAYPALTTTRSLRGQRRRTGYWSPPTQISAIFSLQDIPPFLLWCSSVGALAGDPHEQAALLLANLAAIENDLDAGAIAVIEDHDVRIRRLPTGGT